MNFNKYDIVHFFYAYQWCVGIIFVIEPSHYTGNQIYGISFIDEMNFNRLVWRLPDDLRAHQ